MPKQAAADVFETLGGMAKASAQQVADEAKKAAEEIPKDLGVKPQKAGDDASQTVEENEKKAAAARQKATQARYQEIQKEIKVLEDKRKEEMQKRAQPTPAPDQAQKVKQLETAKPSDKEPVAVHRGKRKREIFRGVSG